jgi:hypothetical protein
MDLFRNSIVTISRRGKRHPGSLRPRFWIQTASGTIVHRLLAAHFPFMAILKKQDRHNAGRNALVAGPVRREGSVNGWRAAGKGTCAERLTFEQLEEQYQ